MNVEYQTVSIAVVDKTRIYPIYILNLVKRLIKNTLTQKLNCCNLQPLLAP